MKRSPTKLPKLALVDRGTIQQRVYQQLREALMKGRFSPGDQVTLRALAKAFGTSAMPVREAVRHLVAEQALVVNPNRSVIVPLLTAERLDELRRIRTALEGMLAEEAADKISSVALEKLGILHDEMCAAVVAGDIKRYLPRNQEFHFTIYAAASLPTALRMVESMWLQIGPVLNFLLREDARAQRSGSSEKGNSISVRHHLEAVQALCRKDGPAVRQAIADDINDHADYFLSLEHFQTAPEQQEAADIVTASNA
jgi:DNA-binding GntR family transcriptional regulator